MYKKLQIFLLILFLQKNFSNAQKIASTIEQHNTEEKTSHTKPNILLQIRENFSLLMGIGFFLNFGSNILTNFIGVSGSGMLFSLLVFFFGYSTKDAIPVYKFCNLMASFINIGYVFTARKKGNQNELYLDWDLAGFCIPLLITGSMIGILIADLFPSFYLMILIMLTLTVALIVIARQKENKKNQNFVQEGRELENRLEIPMVQFRSLQLHGEKVSLIRIFFLQKKAVSVIFFSFLSLVLGNLAKGSIDSPSMFFAQCSFLSFIFYFVFLYAPTLLGTTQVPKLQLRYAKSKLIKIGFYSLLSGVITSFGISGSLIFTSSLIILDLEPMALTSLSRLSMFMSSLAAVIQFFLEGNLNIEDALAIGSISVLGSLVGVYLFFIFQKQKNKNLVKNVLKIILGMSLVIMPVLTWHESQTNDLAFSFGYVC